MQSFKKFISEADKYCSDKCCGSDVKAKDCKCSPDCPHCNCNAVKESVELDELSKKTLGSYVKKASRDVANRSADNARDYAKGNRPVGMNKKGIKNWKREIGIDKAVDKMTKEEVANEAKRKGAPKMTGDSIAIQRAKDAEHNKAMGRTKTGRKKPVRQMTSTQRSLAQLRGEEVELDEDTINSVTANYINENDITLEELENMTEEELNELIGKAIGGAFKVGAKAAVGAARLAKKGANRMSASGRADAAEKKADAVEKRNKDRARIKAAQDRLRTAKAAARENK
jgi:hypothetical protein